jgi:hypothetical protein
MKIADTIYTPFQKGHIWSVPTEENSRKHLNNWKKIIPDFHRQYNYIVLTMYQGTFMYTRRIKLVSGVTGTKSIFLLGLSQ